MCNKTRQKLYFTMILDLEHQQTPLTIRWVAHFWTLKLRVVLRTGLFMHVASHSEAGRAILNEANTRDRTNSQKFGVNHCISSVTNQKGGSMFKTPELSFNCPWKWFMRWLDRLKILQRLWWASLLYVVLIGITGWVTDHSSCWWWNKAHTPRYWLKYRETRGCCDVVFQLCFGQKGRALWSTGLAQQAAILCGGKMLNAVDEKDMR